MIFLTSFFVSLGFLIKRKKRIVTKSKLNVNVKGGSCKCLHRVFPFEHNLSSFLNSNRMRSSSEDNPYAKFLLDNHNKAKKKEVRKRTLRLRRVNDGKGTKAEVARIELKRQRDREYQLRRRIKQSTVSEKQTLTKKRKLSNSSDQNKKDQ